MATVSERGSRRSPGAGAPEPVVSPLPQVNLLPPEVLAAKGARVVRRWLAVGLVLVLGLCGAGYAGSLLVESGAQDDLESAQAETAAIQAETLTYAEVPQVRAELDRAEEAEQLGMGVEVQWGSYLGAVSVLLPDGISLEGFTVTESSPMEAATLSTDVLQDPAVGSIQLVGRSSTLPDTASWIEAMDAIPGLAGTRVATMVISSDDDAGTTFYRVTLTTQVTTEAYSLRFAEQSTEG
ncbi:MAG TPA: fimbrial assembly protein [Cellulomonas sp.]